MRRLPRALAVAGVLVTASLSSPAQGREILGWVEWATLEPSGLRLKAKLDTGAQTSSLHATDVEPFERDGDDWVRFRVPLTDHVEGLSENAITEIVMERPVTRTVLIKQHQGDSHRRYVVTLPFCVAGRRYETQFSLTDRHKWIYPVLLGRRFLGDAVLVDSSDSFLAAAECDWTAPEDLNPGP